MEFFRNKTNIDFMKLRHIAAIISLVLFLSSMLSLLINGLNWGLDFTGGTQVYLSFPKPVNINHLRQSIKHADFKSFQVQSYGSTRDVLITIGLSHHTKHSNRATQRATKQFKELFPLSKVQGVSTIGAKVSKELANKGLLAVTIAMILIAIYIAFRFEYRMAISSAVALIHDPVLILGIFSFFHITFDLTALAAVLTVIGYSLNDTIVVFDRVRENFQKMHNANTIAVVNAAINQTLSRTIMTSALTLMVVLALLFLGGATIYSFAIALVIGIIIGTYSSIYVAGALAVTMGLSRKALLAVTKPMSSDER